MLDSGNTVVARLAGQKGVHVCSMRIMICSFIRVGARVDRVVAVGDLDRFVTSGGADDGRVAAGLLARGRRFRGTNIPALAGTLAVGITIVRVGLTPVPPGRAGVSDSINTITPRRTRRLARVDVGRHAVLDLHSVRAAAKGPRDSTPGGAVPIRATAHLRA